MPVNSFDDYPMSWRPKLSRGKGHIYEELISLLKDDIKNGKLLPGTKLPPQRELADYLDINISTVSRAFKKCEEEGILTSAVGSGTFVAYGALHPESMKPHSGASGTIEMGAMVPSTINTDILTQALREMAAEDSLTHLFEYRFDSRSMWHKEAAARLMARMNYKADPGSIFFSSGGQNALMAVMLSLFMPGDRIGTDQMVFPGFKSLASLLGVRLVPVRSKDREITEEGLLHAIKNENIKGLYVTPDFQNPTTHTMSENCKDMIARTAKKYDIPIIEDQIFSLLMKKPVTTIASRAPEQTIFIASISKTISPGLRTAYISAPEKYTSRIDNALSNINFSVSSVTLELASRIIAGEHLDPLLESVRAKTRTRNLYVSRILKGYELHGTPECPFRWCVLPAGTDVEKLEDDLHKDHVQISSSPKFAVGNSKPVPAIRICACAPKTEDDLELALGKVARHIKQMLLG